MREPVKRKQAGLPHNPGVRELVEGKRKWSAASQRENAMQGFKGWHERGYMPHRDEPGLTQFVTFHLADTFPQVLRAEWEHLWKIEDDWERRLELEAYLDKGRGECHLRMSVMAKLVEDAFLFFQGERYDLRAWVVMPNHVHVLFKVGDTPMSEVIASWKKHTGKEANKILGRQGVFWESDYWDTFMRNEEHELRTRLYIENNPVKAGMAPEVKAYDWSSARFRDEYGRLVL